MLNLPDRASQLAVLHQPLEPTLHTLIRGRVQDALKLGLTDLTHIVVVEPYDSEDDLIEALGFSPLVSRLDGSPLQPDWDWIERHTGYFLNSSTPCQTMALPSLCWCRTRPGCCRTSSLCAGPLPPRPDPGPGCQ